MGLLYHSPADVVRWLLIQLGKGGVTVGPFTIPAGLVTDPDLTPMQAWPCYASDEPNTPDSVVTVYDTTGRDDGRSMIDGERYEHHGVQIRVRAVSHVAGYLKARQIKVALDQAVVEASVTIGTPPNAHSYTIPAVSTSPILTLGKETPSTKRRLFTINAVCPIGELV